MFPDDIKSLVQSIAVVLLNDLRGSAVEQFSFGILTPVKVIVT